MVKSKDILIVVASAVACAALVFGLAVLWPMSNETAGGQAIRAQALLSQETLVDASGLLAQPAAQAAVEVTPGGPVSQEVYPFRSLSGAQIRGIGTTSMALDHGGINPDTVTMIDEAMAPLAAVLKEYPEAPEADRGFGLMVLGGLQEIKASAHAQAAVLSASTMHVGILRKDDQDNPICIGSLPSSVMLLARIQQKQGVLALEEAVASASLADAERMRAAAVDQKTKEQEALAMTSRALDQAEGELADLEAEVASLNDKAGRLSRESGVTVRAEPSKELMDQALAFRAEAQALKDKRDGIGPDGTGTSMAAVIRRLQEEKSHIENSIELIDEQIVVADELLADRETVRRAAADRADVIRQQIALAEDGLFDAMTELTMLAEAFSVSHVKSVEAARDAQKSFSQSVKLLDEDQLRINEAKATLALGAMQFDALMLDRDVTGLLGEMSAAGLDGNARLSPLIEQLGAVAIDAEMVKASAESDLMSAVGIYDKLISRADLIQKPRYQVQQAVGKQMLYILTDDTTHRDQAEALLVSARGTGDPAMEALIDRLDKPLLPMGAKIERTVVPDDSDDMPVEPEAPVSGPVSAADEAAIRDVLKAMEDSIISSDPNAFMACTNEEDGEANDRLALVMFDLAEANYKFGTALQAKYGPDAVVEFNAIESDGLSISIDMPTRVDNTTISIDGDKASAVEEAEGPSLPLVKVDGEWKVDLISSIGLGDIPAGELLVAVREVEEMLEEASFGLFEGMSLIETSESMEELKASMMQAMMESMGGGE
jgi:hypothetical protein